MQVQQPADKYRIGYEDQCYTIQQDNGAQKLVPKIASRKYRSSCVCCHTEQGPDYPKVDQSSFAVATQLVGQPLQKILVIGNGNSGNGKGVRYIDQLKKTFTERAILFEVILPSSVKDMEEKVAAHDLRPYECIFLCGGDGTVFLMLNAIARAHGGKLPNFRFGIINGGTGNDFHFSAGLPKFEMLNEAILRPRFYPLDCGFVKFIDFATKTEKSYYWIANAAFGISGQVTHRAEGYRWMGGKRYEAAALMEILNLANAFIDVILDGNLVKKDYRTTVFHIHNSQTGGNELNLCPFAQVDDGYLDVIMTAIDSRMALFKLFDKVKEHGAHINDERVEYYRAKVVHLVLKEEQVPFQIDGEVFTATKFVEFHCLPKALPCLY